MPLNYRISFFSFLCLAAVFVSSCSTTRSVPEGHALLKKNVVQVKSRTNVARLLQSISNKSELESSLGGYARQKPNKRTLGLFKFNLIVYNRFRNAREHSFGAWLRNNLGEPPVVFDTSLMLSSVTQMQSYLFNKGYLRNEVEATYKVRRRKATVTYTAYPGVQYRIDTLYYPPATNPLRTQINAFQPQTLIKHDAPLDLDKLDDESRRVVGELNNRGYYRFDASLIKYDVDTSNGYDQVKIFMNVLDDSATASTRIYYLRDFKVYLDYEALRESQIPLRDSSGHYKYYYDSLQVKPWVVEKLLFLKHGNVYSRKDYDYTISRLSDLGIFKFISIRYVPVGDDSLDAVIRLTPSMRRVLRADLEGNSVENDVGTGVKFSYGNRNWLLIANKIDYHVNAGTEVPLFKTGHPLYDGNMQLSYTFPRLFAPYPSRKLSPYFNPRTRIGTGVSFQMREGLYRLSSYNASFGYEWHETPTKRHTLNPATFIGLASKPLSDEFIKQLASDPQLNLSFQNQIITGANYAFVFTNPTENRRQSFSYLRCYVETSGFTVYGAQKIFRNKPPVNGKNYTIFGLPYSTYVKTEVDFRRYFVIDPDRQLATRLFAGSGFHFWNSKASLPYIKQYNAGGSSDVRAWETRSLGPGSYRIDTGQAFINQTADIKLEGNVEYRFPIFSVLKGALFLDAGNIWNMRADTSQPGGEFRLNNFYKQIAVGGGLGLRLDFSFFIFRLDLAVPLRDPAVYKLEDDEWIFRNDFRNNAGKFNWGKLRNLIVYNIAIGYPF